MSNMITCKISPDDEFIRNNLSENQIKEFKEFSKNYTLVNSIDSSEKKVLRDSSNPYKCRFCPKESKTKFKEAHVIPRLWGNPKVLSNFECNECNAKFSKYESDFGEYFLFERLQLCQKNRHGKTPKFKNSKGQKSEELNNKNISEKDIELQKSFGGLNSNQHIILINPEEVEHLENKTIIKLTRKPYKPLNVYRVFVKIGISLLKNEELYNFTQLLKLLNNDKFYIIEKNEFKYPLFSIRFRKIPLLKNIFYPPFVYFFEKKDTNENFCDKMLVVFFGNEIYQIPFYSDRNFKYFMKNREITYNTHSPILNPFYSFMKDQSFDKFFGKDFLKMLYNAKIETKNFYCTRLIRNDTFTIHLESDSRFEI